MRISNKIRNFVLWAMLTVVAVAYTGKALHTHSESYYDALRTTSNATSNGMSDECPICHFNLLLFIFDNLQPFTFFTVLLTVIVCVAPIMRSSITVRHLSLRAPPAML